MNRDESLDIVRMILSHWQVKNWTKDEIDAYSKTILHLDAEICTSTVIIAARTLSWAPKPAELIEMYRAERARLRSKLPPRDEPQGQPLPLWVKRWICARMLHEHFNKAQDMRRFAEMGDYGDLTQELMPEGAWEEEAQTLSDQSLLNAFRGQRRS